jgi:hypothetical protein
MLFTPTASHTDPIRPYAGGPARAAITLVARPTSAVLREFAD